MLKHDYEYQIQLHWYSATFRWLCVETAFSRCSNCSAHSATFRWLCVETQLKAATPGSYTFILQATKEVPNRTLHPKRKTIGLRVPDNQIALALLQELGEPLLSCTLMLPEDDEPLTDPYEIRDRLEHSVDLVIDGGWCGTEPTTVIDMTDGTDLIRQGKGDIGLFGF